MTVDVLGAEKFVSSIPNVIYLQNQPAGEFTLCAKVIVIDIGITNAFGENNTGEDGCIRAERSPAGQVPGGLCADALSRIGWIAGKCWSGATWRTRCRRTRSRSVDHRVHISVKEVIHKVKRVIREVPARVGKWVVQSSLVRNANPA